MLNVPFSFMPSLVRRSLPITTAIMGGSSSTMVAQATVQKFTLPWHFAPTSATGSPIVGTLLPITFLVMSIV